MSRSLRVVGAAVALLVLVSCTRESGDSPLSPSPVGRLTIDHLAASISVDGVAGVLRPVRAPAPAGGPQLAAAGNDRVVTGGTQVVTLTSPMPFDTVYVSIDGRGLGLRAEAGGGVEGYYEVRLPAPRLEANVVLAVPQDVPLDRFDLQFAAGTPTGPAATLATLGFRSREYSRMAPYVGFGVGWHQLREEWAAVDAATYLKIGYHVLGGIEYPLGRWVALGAEAQWTTVPKALGESGISAVYGERNLGGTSFRFKLIVGN
jgi:hypothetical protein